MTGPDRRRPTRCSWPRCWRRRWGSCAAPTPRGAARELDADLRARGAVRPLISVLGAQSRRPVRPLVPGHDGRRHEAIALAEANDTPELASLAAAVLALCAAAIGDAECAERAAALLPTCPSRSAGRWDRSASATSPSTRGARRRRRHLRGGRAMSPIGQGLVRWETEWIDA